MTTGHCESSLGSFDELKNSAKRPPTLKPSRLTWAVSPPVVQLSSTTTIAIYVHGLHGRYKQGAI